jgi:hypothetical protein
VSARVKHYVAAHNRNFPTRFAKFGNSPLVSLDEVLFDAGATTRGDTVSRGLWGLDAPRAGPPGGVKSFSTAHPRPESETGRRFAGGAPALIRHRRRGGLTGGLPSYFQAQNSSFSN